MIDSIREGKAPPAIRSKGAQGTLPVGAVEKLEILVLLAQDPDSNLSTMAAQALRKVGPDEVKAALLSPNTPLPVRESIANMAAEREDIRLVLQTTPLFLSGGVPALESDSGAESAPSPPAAPQASGEDAEDGLPTASKDERQSVFQKISLMSTGERIQLALRGNKEERGILIRDANKLVSRSVLGSPKITEQEIETFSAMKNVGEEILRLIARNRRYAKRYSIVRNLVTNPRTPLEISMGMLNRLLPQDVRFLSMNKNIPEALRKTAIKKVKEKDKPASFSYGKK